MAVDNASAAGRAPRDESDGGDYTLPVPKASSDAGIRHESYMTVEKPRWLTLSYGDMETIRTVFTLVASSIYLTSD